MTWFDAAVVLSPPPTWILFIDICIVDLLLKLQLTQFLPQDNQKQRRSGGSELWLQHPIRIFCWPITTCVDVKISALWGGEQWKVANEMSMHWVNSGPKQAAWTQNEAPPPLKLSYIYTIHTHLQTLPLLASTLVHVDTHTFTYWASSCWVTLAFQISSVNGLLLCCKSFCKPLPWLLFSWNI